MVDVMIHVERGREDMFCLAQVVHALKACVELAQRHHGWFPKFHT